jgi:general secretion pathway protein I
MNYRQRGFTLLELLVAVVVLGISLSALLAGFGNYTKQAGYIRDRTLATWVAHNSLNELLNDPTWPATGGKDGEAEMSGQKWRTHIEVRGTDDPQLRRFDIKVYAPDVKEIKTETASAASLTGFIASTGRQ